MSFIKKLKSIFKPKQKTYQKYSGKQLKYIAMKCRLYLQQHYKKCIQKIREQDSILIQMKSQSDSNTCYRILQQISKNVIEVQSINIYVQILKKIQSRADSIISTNGQLAVLKTQLNWFQCLLWYYKTRKIANLQEIYNFCFNFFKGVDLTCQITPKCQIFQVYWIMAYLDPECVVPMKRITPQICKYVCSSFDEKQWQQIININKKQIKKWVTQKNVIEKSRFCSKSKSPIGKKNQTQIFNKNVNEININLKMNKSQVPNSNSSTGIKKNISSTTIQKSYSQLKNNKSNQIPVVKNEHINQYQQWKQRSILQSKEIKNQNVVSNQHSILNQNGKENQEEIKSSSTSLMSKLIKTWKNNKDELVKCRECGVEFSQNNSLNQIQSIEQNTSTSNLCQNCIKIKSLLKQNDNHKKSKCQRCQKFIQRSNSLQINFNQVCHECKQLILFEQNQKLPKENQYKKNYKIIDTNALKKQFQQVSAVSLLNNDSSQMADILHQQSRQGPLMMWQNKTQNDQNKLSKQKEMQVEMVKEDFFDDEESLKFIKESLQTKKFVKKPYMVSIYARAEFLNKVNQK